VQHKKYFLHPAVLSITLKIATEAFPTLLFLLWRPQDDSQRSDLRCGGHRRIPKGPIHVVVVQDANPKGQIDVVAATR
jgi:hypothetical protein